MDYEVFLLSRIKEAHDETGNTNDVVAHGLQRSGRIITSAALTMLIVFLGFAAGNTLGVKEFGLALAIAIDATLIRRVLVPATITPLGNANWWAPTPLRRLHRRIGLHETPAHPVTQPGAPIAALPALPGTPATHGQDLPCAETRREEDLLLLRQRKASRRAGLPAGVGGDRRPGGWFYRRYGWEQAERLPFTWGDQITILTRWL